MYLNPDPCNNDIVIEVSPNVQDVQVNLDGYVTTWGNILGDIENQSDLWSYLSAINVDALTHYLSTNNILMSAATITTDLSVGNNVYVGGTLYTGTTAIVLGTYNAVIGDGLTNTFDIGHNLGTQDVSVTVRDLATNLLSFPSIQTLDKDAIRLTFNFIPPFGSYSVTILAGVPSTRVAAYSPDIFEKPRAYTLYVSMSGRDTNSGREPNFPLRTIKKACQIAHNDRVLAKNDPLEKYTIHVYTGDYVEENPIYVAPNTSIIGDNLRRCTVRPKNKLEDLFWVDNSVYIWGFTFRDNLGNSAATAFPNFSNPILSAIAFSSLLTPFVRSTLVYNKEKCKRDVGYILSGVQIDMLNGNNNQSIINGLTYYNGMNLVIPTAQKTPTIQAIKHAQLLTENYVTLYTGTSSLSSSLLSSISLSFDTVVGIISGGPSNYTNQTFLTADSALSAATIIQNYTEQIKTGVITYLDVLYPDIYKWRKPFITTSPYIQGSSCITTGYPSILQTPQVVTQKYTNATITKAPSSVTTAESLLDTIIGIVSLSSYFPTSFTPPIDAGTANTLLQTFTPYIQDKTIEYISKLYPYITYNQTKCRRDVGFVLSAIRADLLNGNNDEAIINGLAYYNGVTSVLPEDQKIPTIKAFENIKTLAGYVLNGNYIDRGDVGSALDTIINIMTYGPGAATPYSKGVYPGALSAAQLIFDNTSFIQKETIAFVDRTYPGLTYDRQKCERDVGYILSAVRVDIQNGNNTQSIINGLAYYNGNNLYIPQNQVLPTIAAIKYVKHLTSYISNNEAVGEFNSGCGMRVDGSLAEGFLRSMVLDSYTQFNQNGKGIYILNNGYAQLVSIFTICCTEGIRCESGGTCSISNSNCSFGLSGITSTGKSPMPLLTGTLVRNPFGGNTFVVTDVEGTLINPNSDYYSPNAPIDTRKIAYTPYNGLVFRVGNDPELFVIDTPSPALSAGTTDTFTINVVQNTFKNFNPGDYVQFYLRSAASASSHTFEYIGTGVYLDRAVPALGGITRNELEVCFDDGGTVFYTSTNEGGDFNVGEEFVIVQETGTIEGDTFKRSILTLVTPLTLALE